MGMPRHMAALSERRVMRHRNSRRPVDFDLYQESPRRPAYHAAVTDAITLRLVFPATVRFPGAAAALTMMPPLLAGAQAETGKAQAFVDCLRGARP